jgi:ribosomal protein L40E
MNLVINVKTKSIFSNYSFVLLFIDINYLQNLILRNIRRMILMPFMDSISKLAKTVGDQATIASKKANDALEIAKINTSIKSEEDKIQKVQCEIGKIIFEKFEKGEPVDSEVLESCSKINEIRNNIEVLKQKIILIKNVKICHNCKAEVALNATFCNKCGAKQEIPAAQATEVVEEKLTCPNCGVEISEDTVFCSSCGTKTK